MALRWQDVYPGVATLLKDDLPENSNRQHRYLPEDVRAWWNNAQTRLSTMSPVRKFQQYRLDDGLVLPLPKNFYRPIGLFIDGNPESLPRLNIDSSLFSGNVYGYYIYEEKLCLALSSFTPEKWILLYDTYYPRLDDDESRVLVPEWAIEACTIYVAIQACTREMFADAKYRKFTSPEDAGGNPQHNPYTPVARWLRERFYEIVSNHVDDDGDS